MTQETTQTTPYLSVAMAIEGTPTSSTGSAVAAVADSTDGNTAVSRPIRAVYVADTDLMLPQFSAIRADPNSLTEVKYQFQNVTFILNCVDWVAGETDFIEIRKHQPIFASLTMIDAVKQELVQVKQSLSDLNADKVDRNLLADQLIDLAMRLKGSSILDQIDKGITVDGQK